MAKLTKEIITGRIELDNDLKADLRNHLDNFLGNIDTDNEIESIETNCTNDIFSIKFQFIDKKK